MMLLGASTRPIRRHRTRMPTREPWAALPHSLRSAVEDAVGEVLSVDEPAMGRSSEFSAMLTTVHNAFFWKGVRTDRSYAWTHRNEAVVGPLPPPDIAPMLLWEIERDGWLMLGFERALGVHSSLSRGSPDLDAVRELVVRIGDELTPCPAEARRLSDRCADAPGWAAPVAAARRPGTRETTGRHGSTMGTPQACVARWSRPPVPRREFVGIARPGREPPRQVPPDRGRSAGRPRGRRSIGNVRGPGHARETP